MTSYYFLYNSVATMDSKNVKLAYNISKERMESQRRAISQICHILSSLINVNPFYMIR